MILWTLKYSKQGSDRTIFVILNVFDSESQSQDTLQKCCNSQNFKELKPLSRLYANPCSSPCRYPAWEVERKGTSAKFLLFDILYYKKSANRSIQIFLREALKRLCFFQEYFLNRWTHPLGIIGQFDT